MGIRSRRVSALLIRVRTCFTARPGSRGGIWLLIVCNDGCPSALLPTPSLSSLRLFYVLISRSARVRTVSPVPRRALLWPARQPRQRTRWPRDMGLCAFDGSLAYAGQRVRIGCQRQRGRLAEQWEQPGAGCRGQSAGRRAGCGARVAAVYRGGRDRSD